MVQSSFSTQESGEETKEEEKEDEIVLQEAVDKLAGCFGDDCYPSDPERDNCTTKDLSQEPPH
jgi:hypothetical protein